MRRPMNLPPRPPAPRPGRGAAEAVSVPADGFGVGLPGRAATLAETAAQAHLPINPRMGAQVASMRGMRDVITNDEALARRGMPETPPAAAARGYVEPETRTPENLPAVISRAIRAAGDRFEPRWHMVRRLPGYMQEQIRGVARPVFRQFTSTAIEDIQVLSTASNSEVEVKMMMSWIARNGTRVDEADIDMERIIPGYRASAQKWVAEEYSFLLVKDEWGYYVYGWPREDDLALATGFAPALPGL